MVLVVNYWPGIISLMTARIIRKIQNRASQYSPEEIESDVSHAVKEVREEKGDH